MASVKNGGHVMTEAEHKKNCRRAELQLAITNAIALARTMETGAFGHLTDFDEFCVLTRMASERANRL